MWGTQVRAVVMVDTWANGARKVLGYIPLSNWQVIPTGFHGNMKINLDFTSQKDELGTQSFWKKSVHHIQFQLPIFLANNAERYCFIYFTN